MKKLMMMLLLLLTSATAHAINCGEKYTVLKGDTLSLVAQKAYQDGSKWNLIYLKNKKIIGSNPNSIRVNSKLTIPCTDVSFTSSEPANSTPASTSVATKSFSKQSPDVVELVTSDWEPYIGKELPEKGMFMHITKEVFNLIPNTTYTARWINDWSAHLNILLKEGKYDIGPGWYKPEDCSDKDNIPDSDVIRCEYKFSDPIYEDIITLFNKVDTPNSVTKLSELEGKNVCQPKGYLLFNYKEVGLVNGENFTLIKEPSTTNCMQKLKSGIVDYVAINKNEGDKVISNLGLRSDIESRSTSPVKLRSIHYVIHQTHPKADVLMYKINKGLRELKANGKLEEIQAKHILYFQNSL